MKNCVWTRLAVIAVLLAPTPLAAEHDLKSYLDGYFGGNAINFGYGTGVSSGSPRVELAIQYCRNGAFFSQGRSCRPNVYASGHQCSRLSDTGQWRIVTQGKRAQLQWVTRNGNQGSVELRVRRDGVVVDPNGNPFVRVAPAQC